MKKISAKFDACVLVVEDYQLNAEVIKEMLELMGCQVNVAENGIIALEMVSKSDYDLIFMDVQMPIMDGLEATREIRKLDSKKAKVPIVALTANALQGDQEKYLASGMDDFISKPLRAAEIERVLSKFMPRKILVK